MDKLEDLVEEDQMTGESHWDEKQNEAFEQIKDIFVDVFNDKEVAEAAEKFLPCLLKFHFKFKDWTDVFFLI
ncbi:MAG: hypothetical protein IPL23_28375 [Saprospiraceae bacterium]|nr:hypothetical protein [Saprospiraceae bacterium]